MLPTDRDVRQVYKSAVELFESGNMDGAINEFKKLIASYPQYKDVNSFLGHAYFQNKNYDEAVKYFTIAANVNPNLNVLISLGISLGQIKKINQSIEVFELAIKKYSDSADCYAYLAIALRTAQKHEEAISNFNKAISLNPNHLGANWGLGVTYGILGKKYFAQKQFIKVISLKPNFAPAHFHLAHIYLANNEYDKLVSELLILEKLDVGYFNSLKQEMSQILNSDGKL